jgi:tol-pal system protein YbgF
MRAAALGLRHTLRFRVWRLFPVVALAATGGCFATRGDVRLVQSDIASLRAESLKHQLELREALAQTIRMLTVASDSLAKVSARTVGIQGDVRGEMRSIREQMVQVQTLLGQSQATIARLRSEIESRTSLPPVVPPAAPLAAGTLPPASGRNSLLAGADSAVPTRAPGPNQLYTDGRDQLTRGSTATARTYFQELLTNHPTSDYAPDAQFWIAESFAKEKNLPAADAAYAAVASVHPTSEKAPTALYKRAQLAIQQSSIAQARQLLEQVIARYPRSNEAELAADQLKTLR